MDHRQSKRWRRIQCHRLCLRCYPRLWETTRCTTRRWSTNGWDLNQFMWVLSRMMVIYMASGTAEEMEFNKYQIPMRKEYNDLSKSSRISVNPLDLRMLIYPWLNRISVKPAMTSTWGTGSRSTVEIFIFINKGNPCLETNLEVDTHFNLETNVVDFMGGRDNHNKEASLEIINNIVVNIMEAETLYQGISWVEEFKMTGLVKKSSNRWPSLFPNFLTWEAKTEGSKLATGWHRSDFRLPMWDIVRCGGGILWWQWPPSDMNNGWEGTPSLASTCNLLRWPNCPRDLQGWNKGWLHCLRRRSQRAWPPRWLQIDNWVPLRSSSKWWKCISQVAWTTTQPGGTYLEASTSLRMWQRHYSRAEELGATVPDPTLMVGALDKIMRKLLQGNQQANFRSSAFRMGAANCCHGQTNTSNATSRSWTCTRQHWSLRKASRWTCSESLAGPRKLGHQYNQPAASGSPTRSSM